MAEKGAFFKTAVRKTIKCRAAIAREAGKPLVIVAPPKAYEVRIKIICTSLCFSDVTFWRMKVPPACFPRIFGHEADGVVESVGEDVHDLAAGDMVIPIFMPDCQECIDCKSRKSNLCSKVPFAISPTMLRVLFSSRFTDMNGEIINHFLWISSFSEYTVVDVASVTKIDPNTIPPNRACLLNCGVSTGNSFKSVEVGSSVVIFGLVTEFVNSKSCVDKSVSQVILDMTEGGADYCFECVGMASLVKKALFLTFLGWGKTIVLGVDKSGAQLNLNTFEVLHSGKTLLGSLYGGLKPKSDIPILIKRCMDKELELDKFLTHEVSFEDINKAFKLLIAGESLRCVI
ncbi:hypothetical protein M9H77_18894 [Catharanthus roseus]|uniref:Uncharacterized protein n=1 Tax=Catharanthus roseus TaxID=4058 RepID=A0ACC0B8S8_CATRO|nr:hypothetical protein M9H77_18894 [Catharanthus roseus]